MVFIPQSNVWGLNNLPVGSRWIQGVTQKQRAFPAPTFTTYTHIHNTHTTCIHMYRHMHTQRYMLHAATHMFTHTHEDTQRHMYTHTYTCVYTYAYRHTYTHTYIHTGTPTPSCTWVPFSHYFWDATVSLILSLCLKTWCGLVFLGDHSTLWVN